jgi:hypothetical protein
MARRRLAVQHSVLYAAADRCDSPSGSVGADCAALDASAADVTMTVTMAPTAAAAGAVRITGEHLLTGLAGHAPWRHFVLAAHAGAAPSGGVALRLVKPPPAATVRRSKL